jgi:UrcA family protein
MFRTVAIVSALALGALAQPAFAAEINEIVVFTRHVKVGDLNLNDRAGAQSALERIDAAARSACAGVETSFPVMRAMFVAQCRTDAVRGAVDRAGVPMLTLMLAARSVGVTGTLAKR